MPSWSIFRYVHIKNLLVCIYIIIKNSKTLIFLGLKYLLSVVNLNHETIINVIYPKVFKGIKDVVDDVVSEAASALIPVVKQFVHHIDLVGIL